jgi:hypothetical protein
MEATQEFRTPRPGTLASCPSHGENSRSPRVAQGSWGSKRGTQRRESPPHSDRFRATRASPATAAQGSVSAAQPLSGRRRSPPRRSRRDAARARRQVEARTLLVMREGLPRPRAFPYVTCTVCGVLLPATLFGQPGGGLARLGGGASPRPPPGRGGRPLGCPFRPPPTTPLGVPLAFPQTDGVGSRDG